LPSPQFFSYFSLANDRWLAYTERVLNSREALKREGKKNHMELDIMDYIDWDEGRDFGDATASAAVDPCENCGRTGERLTLIPEWEYMGCDDCMAEALAVLAAEAAERQAA
jgi:hypothetical protein